MSKLNLTITVVAAAALQACGGGGEPSARMDLGGLSGKGITATSTAQVIWSDLGPSTSELVIVDQRRYVFEKVASFCQSTTYSAVNPDGSCTDSAATATPGAASFYGSAPQVSAVAWTCTGNTTNCGAANQPAEPATPAAPTLESLLGDAECAFWDGQALPTLSRAVSQGVNGLNGKGQWTATWTFTYAPLSSDPVAPKTAFGYDQLLSDAVPVALGGYFYGESAKQGAKDPGPKYSFSMRASDGSIRVSDVSVSWVLAGDPTAVPTTVLVPSTSVTLEENVWDQVTNTDSVEFDITTELNAVTINGDKSLLKFSDASITRRAGAVLLGDWFPGNDHGGADGSAQARVKIDAGSMTATTLGTYNITFSATVKDLSAVGTAGQVTVQRQLVVGGQPNSCHSAAK